MKEERVEWMRNLFNALTSQTISRNRHFAAFSSGGAKQVLRRFRTIRALIREADRLAPVPGTRCWVSRHHGGMTFHLECPPLQYRHAVDLYQHEWEWLGGHESVQALLSVKPLEA